MQTQPHLLEDLARMANSSTGIISGIQKEIETIAKHRISALLNEMELVTRDEFDATKAMLVKAREEQELLHARIAKLEAQTKAPNSE